MKKENLILVISFVLMFVLSIILVSVIRVFPTSKVDEMFGQKVQIVNEKTVLDSDYVNIRTHAEVMSLNNEKLADIYTVTVNHATYFDMELYVAIDAKGEVYAIDKSVTTNDSTSASYFKDVRSYLLKNYNGIYYENVQFVDGAAGATTIGVSRSMIKNAVSQTVIYHNGEPVDHIALLLGNTDYTLVSQSTVSDVLISEVTLNGTSLKVYQRKMTGTYYDSSATNEGDITVLIALNQDKTIVNVLLPEDFYGHTGGGFYNDSKAYLEGYLNLSINTETLDFTSGPTGNSEGSQYLISQIIESIQEVA